MTKSKGKGGKNRRKCKRSKYAIEGKLLEFKEKDQDYAIILDRKGGPIVTLRMSETNEEKLGVIRGKMRKRSWIASGDIVLVGLRNFQETKVDILQKYDNDEIRKLINYGELKTDFVNSTSSIKTLDDDCGFDFTNIDDI